VQITLHQVRRRGHGAPVDVIDEQHRRQQENDGAARGARRIYRRCGRRAQFA
jgi:hypothetical protein